MDTTLAHHGGMVAKLCNTQMPIILIETHFSSQHCHNMAAKFRNTQTPLTLIAHITAQEGSIKWTQHWHSMAAR